MSIKPVDCPLFWTAEQAAAVVDYLDRLSEVIWETYSEEIIELRTAELKGEADTQPDDDQYRFEFDRSQSDYE